MTLRVQLLNWVSDERQIEGLVPVVPTVTEVSGNCGNSGLVTAVICHSGSDIRAPTMNGTIRSAQELAVNAASKVSSLWSQGPQMGSQMVPKTWDLRELWHVQNSLVHKTSKQMAAWFKLTSRQLSFTAWTLNTVLPRADLCGHQHLLCKWNSKYKEKISVVAWVLLWQSTDGSPDFGSTAASLL